MRRRPQDVGSRTASDPEGRTPTYRLEGPNRNLFSIDSSGLVKTRSGLNHEDPACGYPGTGGATSCTYTVLVKVADGEGASIFQEFTIAINDLDETPSVPSAPRVTATTGSGKSLEVSWSEPGNTGPPITDYNIQYRELGGSDDDWIDWPHGTEADSAADSTKRTTKITGLDPRTTYEVEVQATNDEGTSAWSSAGRGTTGASNLRPSFDNTASLVTLSVNENTRAGQPVGSPVSATDNDGNRLTHTLAGPGADSFTIVSSSGQIRTRAALDHEERSSYSVTVKVNDGQRKDNSVAAKSVTIEIANVDEIPSVPAAPAVSGIPGSTSSIRVTWAEPANTGPAITDYDVHYGVAGTGGFVNWQHLGVDTSTIITGLTAGTRYEVQVRAWNADGFSDYSRSGTGSPNPDVANRNPVFSGGSRTFSVAENTAAGDPIGDPVDATDPDDDPLAYELEGTNAASFELDRGSGQIRTSAALNHEDKSRYSVTVRVRDGRGGTSTAGVTINVTDVVEPPDTPLSPRVTAVSSTGLQVSWDEPDNIGPSITDYDYRYMSSTDSSWTEITNTTITATSVTIQGLTPSTSYDVEVRAKNSEGTSEWSSPGIGSTNAPGANNPPVFSEGASATRSVSASAPTGTSIGLPVAATDADSNDTLTYSLEGRDAASFAINETNGQLLTKSGVTLLAGETYTVIVAADDQTDSARITVAIEATVAPPNNPPVFSDGASTTRSVRAGAPAGTSIGLPVTATDADQGDTLNYSLEGQDAASFNINTTTGQLLTISGVTLDRSSYTVMVVASDGTASASITVTITVVLNNPPTFSAIHPRRIVAENTPAGANIGSPISATDPDQGDTLTYTLAGNDAASFDIVSTSGQLRTKAALDFEMKSGYSVTVTADDGNGGIATITVTISVMDVIERPSRPAAPTITATSGSTESLDVSWDEPDNQGPPITDYDVQYREGSGGSFTSVTHDGTATTTRITGLTAGTTYEVQVRATNDEGIGEWSASGTGLVPGANNPPTFSASSASRSVDENTPAGQNVGIPVSATDPNTDDTLTYSLSGADDASFDILSTTGQIQTKAALDYETKNSYRVTVTVSDGEFTDSITVTITIGDMHPSCASAIGNGANTGLVNDCEALLDSKDALQGPTGSLNWATFIHISQWDGITLRGDPLRVAWLNIRDGGLNGSVPADLGRLSNLTYLNLRTNNLTGEIPDELGRLTNLQKLLLHNNSLSGDFPDLRSLTNLTHLWLSGADHSVGAGGGIPTWLSGLTNLVELNLWGNDMGGTIPNLSRLSSLKLLKLQNNNLRGSIPTWLGNMNSLSGLYLHNNDLTGSIPKQLGRLTTLRRLWLDRNDLTGTIPQELGNMSNLGTLNLHTNRLTGDIPTQLADLSRLQHFGLHNNQLSGTIPRQLGSLGELTRLWVSTNNLTGPIPSELRMLGKLQSLNLHTNQLTGDIPAELGDLGDTLTRLRLGGNTGLTGCVPAALAGATAADDLAGAGSNGLEICQ